MKHLLILLCGLVGAMPACGADASPSKPGFFQVHQDAGGRWVFLDPQGKPFFSTGVDCVSFKPDVIYQTTIRPYTDYVTPRYGSIENWRVAQVKRLFGWGFNTLGAWSTPDISKVALDGRHLAYAFCLNENGAYFHAKDPTQPPWIDDTFPDVFASDYPSLVAADTRTRCSLWKDDPNLLGWFSDNELPWQPDWRGPNELLVRYLNFPSSAPGRQVALDLLRRLHPDIQAFNQIWGTSFTSWDAAVQVAHFSMPKGISLKTSHLQNGEENRNADAARTQAFLVDCNAFLGLIADRYFQTMSDAIRAADPNHLYLGCRFAYVPAVAIMDVAAKYVDVISFNCYAADPTSALLRYDREKKPLLIGEFTFKAKDSGLPNTIDAGPLVKTQADRAAGFAKYALAAARDPNLIGYHWFKYTDPPRQGSFDGQNSNVGILTIHDEPYALLLQKMTEINRQALAIHLGAAAAPAR